MWVCQVAREKQRGYDVLLCADLVEIFDETKNFDLVVAADVFELGPQGLTGIENHEDSIASPLYRLRLLSWKVVNYGKLLSDFVLDTGP